MTTTTDVPTNQHQHIVDENYFRCAAPDCGYAMYTHPIRHRPEEQATEFWENQWRRLHADQYAPGRAPDITVDWEISACCSVCPDGIGDIKVEDSDTIRCEECATTWDMRGDNGYRNNR